ncbi:helix-turn-helix domain-containing protein [Nocardioides aurantiacus]|uniref:helix-turn-helix domain-containing protein n=1 Tax=Nocardioides aurantiacus TaxID=86796 RepID=UPI00403F0468
MQELLGRIARLDPSASLGLRVIACFDELVVGRVNTRALLAAAASLAGCPAGFRQDRPARQVRVDPRGRVLPPGDPDPAPGAGTEPAPGLCVWLEREGPPLANDAIILERLALAVRIRQGLGRRDLDHRRDLGLLVDADVAEDERCVAATAIGLSPHQRYRVATAPLFAVWGVHPSGPEDVVATRHGPLHALVLPEDADHLDASPAGLGVATDVAHLHHSFRTAVVALQLADPPTTPSVRADDYGGLVGLLADAAPDAHQPDADRLEEVARHPWGRTTLEALLGSASVRQAARTAGVHHSTMQARVDTVARTLGYDPFDGFGRTRLGTAYLVWRLRHSRVLDLPAPG